VISLLDPCLQEMHNQIERTRQAQQAAEVRLAELEGRGAFHSPKAPPVNQVQSASRAQQISSTESHALAMMHVGPLLQQAG
jgi:hypothetical protein